MANRLYTLFLIFLLVLTLAGTSFGHYYGSDKFDCFGETHSTVPRPPNTTLSFICPNQPFSEQPDGFLMNCPKLNTLDFSEGNITHIGEKTLKGPEALDFINYEKGKVARIHPMAFCANTKNAKVIKLGGNPLVTVMAKVFTCLKELGTLEIDDDVIPCGRDLDEWKAETGVNVTGRCRKEKVLTTVDTTPVPTSRSDVKGVNSVNTTISSNQPQTAWKFIVAGVVLASIAVIWLIGLTVCIIFRKKIKEMYRKLRRVGHPNQEEDAEQGSTMLPREDNAVVLYTALDEPGKVS